ncbi:IclR family transcriptional regulator [Cupriavidus alkaliphilus]|uniref:DNA-binding IclR family transcriptional regulator n=1 Tax=Cupriavidus alkaliphilus TaxID=942866 RepID=A0A7W4V6V5_9BURK|nr:IclR family transcriptional regulator [Cupriavidus alkaliphilus]MBB3006146.1 DNA-binding IclR family transcriptional regulator [Cupriavidus alkaliphilus]SCB16779.1 transcriptional regulator, IclR family [Cupriavidus alkaliphilus]
MAANEAAEKSGYGSVKTALRVIEIMEIYAREGRSLTLTELAKLLGAPMSSCLGLIRTLASLGYLYETGRRQGYYPTRRLLDIAQRIARNDPLLERVQPVLESLRDTTGETVVFGKLQDDGRVLYLEVRESPNPVRYIAAPGELRDAHVNSIGRAILGTLTPGARAELLSGVSFAARTPRTISSAQALEAAMQGWQKQGWYPNFGESFPDLGAIAVPVTIGGVTYGLSVAGPLHRVEINAQGIIAALEAAAPSLQG